MDTDTLVVVFGLGNWLLIFALSHGASGYLHNKLDRIEAKLDKFLAASSNGDRRAHGAE